MRCADMGKEEAEAFMAETYGSVLFEQLKETVWKARLEAVDTVLNKVDSLGVEAVGVRTCMALAIVPGWKDSNFQVLHRASYVILLPFCLSPQGYAEGCICF